MNLSFIRTMLRVGLGAFLVTSLFLFNNMETGFTGAPIHSGSWFGLPDFGISEIWQGKLSTSPSPTGFANQFGVPVNTTVTPDTTNSMNLPKAVSSGGLFPTNSTQSPQNPSSSSSPFAAPTQFASPTPSGPSPEDALRSQIGSGWDQYISSLDSQLEGLSGQRTAQERIAQSQLNTGMNTLGLQKTQGEQQLNTQRERANTNQTKTLRDLASNLRNSFMAGNVYLGARGAGDSSAANQYSYGLTKLGSQQRGDVMGQTAEIMSQIDERETNLKNVYDTETRNLQETYNQRVNEIATWFSEAQNQVRMAKSTGQLNKSQDLANLSRDLYNQGMNMLSQIQQQVQQKRGLLDQWVANNATSIEQARSQMAKNAQFTAALPGFSPIAGSPQMDAAGNIRVAQGYGSTDEKLKNLFTNPSSWLTSV